jgi:signal peptidase I
MPPTEAVRWDNFDQEAGPEDALTEAGVPELPLQPGQPPEAAGSTDSATATANPPAEVARWEEPGEEPSPLDASAVTGALSEPEPSTARIASDDDPWAAFDIAGEEPGLPATDEPVSPSTEDAHGAAFEDRRPDVDPASTDDSPAPVAASAATAGVDDAPSAVAGGAPSNVDDDPWAAFMAGREAEEHGAAGKPDAAADLDSPLRRWEEVYGGAAESATPSSQADGSLNDDSGSRSDEEDPWAAIAIASGYDADAPGGVAVYRGTPDPEPSVEDDRDEDRSHAEPAEFASAPSAELGPIPEWARPSDEDDVILKAFEAHAIGPSDEPEDAPYTETPDPAEAAVFTDLLGEGGDELVSEVTAPDTDHHTFARLQGWAPQRTLTASEVGAVAQWSGPPPPAASPEKPSSEPGEWSEHDEDSDDDQPPWDGPAPFGGSAVQTIAPRQTSRTRTLVRELIETGLLALLVFLAVRASFQNFKVDGSSMYPTLEDGQFLIVNKLVYSEVDMDKLSNFLPFLDAGDSAKRNVFHGPERGDIVVLRDPRKPDNDLIKRIIGLPGETIEIVNDEQNGAQVYINDHLLEEPYIKSPWHDSKPKVQIPEGYYFVMGDNRDYSLDSRSQQVGLVAQDNIIGKAMLSYWPTSKFGLAPNQGGNISEKDGRPQLSAQRIGE